MTFPSNAEIVAQLRKLPFTGKLDEVVLVEMAAAARRVYNAGAARFFTDSRSFYCVQCLGGYEQTLPGGESEHMEAMDNFDLGAVYCCNCGRDDGENADAHLPGHAVHGDFEYTTSTANSEGA